jgi:hypothetical protein
VEEAARHVQLLRDAFAKVLDDRQEAVLISALARMPLDVGAAAIRSVIDNEERFPGNGVAMLNRHAKALGWEPERPVIQTVEEREMMVACRDRFSTALGVRRSDEPQDLRYYSMLGSFRWALRHGSWGRVEAHLNVMGQTAQAVAAHVRAEVEGGKVIPAVRQETIL